MDALSILNVMATLSIDELDIAGAHINEHLIDQTVLIEKLAAMINADGPDLEKEKSYSIFINKELAEEKIHEVLLNSLNQKRIQKWYEADDYKKRTRIIIGYPTENVIGYKYNISQKTLNREECRFINVVLLKTEKSFIFYTAYPEKNQSLTIL